MTTNRYDLKIIDDARVPLSAGTPDYSGIAVATVLVCIVIAILIMYWLWFRSHKKRIIDLSVMGIDGSSMDMEGMDEVSIFHPIRTMRYEMELENLVVSATARSV